MSGAPVYEVLLEKKGRGRNFMGRPWTVRTFKLKAQSLDYYDGDKLKGTINVTASKSAKVPAEEADGKLFPFAVNTSEEKILLNASCEEIRARCIELFNQAAINKNWSLHPPKEEPKEEIDIKIEQATKEFEVASTAAVASVFAENAEKKRLEEEERKLEEERKQHATAAAAKMMEEELANKKLREAKEAEQKQKEEQVRNENILLHSIISLFFI
jgi:flagellar biosynthesis GTPase FlhF